MNADPLAGPADDEQLDWLGDALVLIKGRPEHDALAQALTDRRVYSPTCPPYVSTGCTYGATGTEGKTLADCMAKAAFPPLTERQADQLAAEKLRAENLRRSVRLDHALVGEYPEGPLDVGTDK